MSIKNPQLPVVSSSRGAPMGRVTREEGKDKPMRCFRLRFVDGCYDEGGAYWGAPANVYCATNDHGFQAFERADSRDHAMDRFEEQYGPLKWVVPRRGLIKWR